MKRALFVLLAALLLVPAGAGAAPILTFTGTTTVEDGAIRVDITQFTVSGTARDGTYYGEGAWLVIDTGWGVSGFALDGNVYSSASDIFNFPSASVNPCYVVDDYGHSVNICQAGEVPTYSEQWLVGYGDFGTSSDVSTLLPNYLIDGHPDFGRAFAFSGNGTDFKHPHFAFSFGFPYSEISPFTIDGRIGGTTTITNAPVPEPSSLLLLGAGLAGLAGAARRRRQR